MSRKVSCIAFIAVIGLVALPSKPCIADGLDEIRFDSVSFTLTDVFNEITLFEFELEFGDVQIAAGQNYVNPPLTQVTYQVVGVLTKKTPSGFPAFSLGRDIPGAEFYEQGSSMEFEIRSDALIDDGIQVSELVNGLLLNAREVGTGRYHPPIIELFPDGTGRIQNSNNMGGINPFTMEKVDVDFGEEYIVDLTFDADELTIIEGYLLADLNRDCQVDLLDVAPFIDALLDPAYDYLADLNQDGFDNLLDVPVLIQYLGGH